MNASYPFVLPPLPYRTYALEPYLDEQTIDIHHNTLFQGYVDRLNAALQKYPQFQHWSFERLIVDNEQLPTDIQQLVYNNAGGVYNHTAYFASMTPNYLRPSNYMRSVIEDSFHTMESFRAQMQAAGLSVFGSGWAWLVRDQGNHLRIVATKNQDTPLPQGLLPLLPLDVWEHAYFLQYYSERITYIKNWFRLINWKYVEKRCLHKL